MSHGVSLDLFRGNGQLYFAAETARSHSGY